MKKNSSISYCLTCDQFESYNQNICLGSYFLFQLFFSFFLKLMHHLAKVYIWKRKPTKGYFSHTIIISQSSVSLSLKQAWNLIMPYFCNNLKPVTVSLSAITISLSFSVLDRENYQIEMKIFRRTEF